MDYAAAEDAHMKRAEAHEAYRELEENYLYLEYMEALKTSLVSTVRCPTPTNQSRVYPVAECFLENLASPHNRSMAAIAIAILMRDPAGREICEAIAAEHARDYT